MSNRETEAISEEERRFENGESPSVLDVIRIPMLEHKPESYQSENHLIDDGYYWKRIRHASWQEAAEATDAVTGALWGNGYRSTNGENDRIPEGITRQLDFSLLLIEPKDLIIHCIKNQSGKKQVRGKFQFNGHRYDLAVTDPKVERHCLGKGGSEYPVQNALLCISLGEIFEGHAYKLIASVITEARGRQRQ